MHFRCVNYLAAGPMYRNTNLWLMAMHCVRPLRLIVGMGIRQVSQCQAQPVDLKQGASDDIKQARAKSCDQHGRKSTKSIGNQPSRVVKLSTSWWSRSTKQPSRSLRSTRSTTGSTSELWWQTKNLVDLTYFAGHYPLRKKWTQIGIFKPAELHDPWAVC